MAYPVVREGDKLVVLPPEGASWFPPAPIVPLKGTGRFTACGPHVCVPTDIEQMAPVTAHYVRPGFPVKGTGTLTFHLASAHKAAHSNTKGGLPIVIDDGRTKLTYTYTVSVAASNDKGFDPTPPTSGNAEFLRLPMPRPVNAG
ncbi:hypothetical protein ACFW1M_03110 [Streptomyces inhibens]|uniref:hypothetical protein n=1 Tax=Streptomyces inhibens TaxID=2293571 RepID=UPI0036860F6A